MSGQPLTAQAVADHLAELGRKLDDLVKQIGVAEIEAVNRREDYTMAYAQAFLRALGAMDARKQIAIEQTHVQRLDAELEEATVRGLRRQIDSLKVRVDIGRSAGVALRSEVSLAGSGVTP